eukprot:510000_1
MVVGYDSTANTIWLFGGRYSRSLIEFNVTEWNSTDPNPFQWIGSEVLPISIPGSTAAQHKSYIYIISNYHIHRVHLATQKFFVNWQDAPIYGCVAAINDYLFLSGGTTLHIFNISSNLWLSKSNIPPLTVPRKGHCCVAVENNKHLYLITGNNGTHQLTTVDVLYIGDIDTIDQYQFTLMANTLDVPSFACAMGYRAVVYINNIYVMGGHYFSHVYIIDTTANTIQLKGSFGCGTQSSLAVVMVDNRIYEFGGVSPLGYTRCWSFCDLPTPEPTNSPSNDPSTMPTDLTIEPTQIPSISPTRFPSEGPTTQPSLSPSSSPSATPTNSPILAPTNSPSQNPTYSPTISPSWTTLSPSQVPSSPPSAAPTFAPSYPTFNPTTEPTNFPSNGPSKSPTKEP